MNLPPLPNLSLSTAADREPMLIQAVRSLAAVLEVARDLPETRGMALYARGLADACEEAADRTVVHLPLRPRVAPAAPSDEPPPRAA